MQIRNDVLEHVFEYLDWVSLVQVRQTCKRFYRIATTENFIRKKLFEGSAEDTYHETPDFYLNPAELVPNLCTEEKNLPYRELLETVASKLKTPFPLIERGFESSSHDYNQTIDCTLSYENINFWSSKGSDTKQDNEYLIYELRDQSFVFSVHFLLYRAVYQGGPVYPPQRAKVSIGNSPDEYHYHSQEFFVSPTEYLNTVLVLPKIVIGKYVRIDLLGKVVPQPGDEKFYSVLEYAEVLGYPLNFLNQNSSLASQKPKVDMQKDLPYKAQSLEEYKSIPSDYITPLAFPLLQKRFKVVEHMDSRTRRLNPIESYNFLKSKETEITEQIAEELVRGPITPSEMIGDFYFEKGFYEASKNIYSHCRIPYKVCRSCIALKEFSLVKRILRIQDPRLPSKADLVSIARDLGEDYLNALQYELSDY